MDVSEAMKLAEERILHYEDFKQNFADTPEEEAYYQRNADMLRTLCGEITRLRSEAISTPKREGRLW